MHDQLSPSSTARPDLAAGGAEVQPHGIAGIGAERLALHRPPRLLAREPAILPLPRSRRRRACGTQPASRRGSRAATLRCRPSETPRHSRDRADAARSGNRCRRRLSASRGRSGAIPRPADPADRCRSDSADTDAMGCSGCSASVCGSCPNSASPAAGKSASTPRLSGCHDAPPSLALEHAAGGESDVEMARILRIDADRMQQRAVRNVFDSVFDAREQAVVEAGDLIPGHAAVGGAEQPDRRGARVPDVRLGCMRRREPEHAVHRAAVGVAGLLEHGRTLCLGPGATRIERAKHRRTEMTGLRCHQQRAAIARIQHQMIDDIAQEVRPVDTPVRRVASPR